MCGVLYTKIQTFACSTTQCSITLWTIMTRIAPHSRQNYCIRTSNNYTVLLHVRTLHIEILVCTCIRFVLGVAGKTMKESTSNEALNIRSSSFY